MFQFLVLKQWWSIGPPSYWPLRYPWAGGAVGNSTLVWYSSAGYYTSLVQYCMILLKYRLVQVQNNLLSRGVRDIASAIYQGRYLASRITLGVFELLRVRYIEVDMPHLKPPYYGGTCTV